MHFGRNGPRLTQLVECLTVVGKHASLADIRMSPVQVRERGPISMQITVMVFEFISSLLHILYFSLLSLYLIAAIPRRRNLHSIESPLCGKIQFKLLQSSQENCVGSSGSATIISKFKFSVDVFLNFFFLNFCPKCVFQLVWSEWPSNSFWLRCQ